MAAQQQLEQMQGQLQQAVARLQERELQLAQALEQNNNLANVQGELNRVREQLEDREQQLAEVQLAQPDIELQRMQRELAQIRLQLQTAGNNGHNLNDEFSRGRVPDLIKGVPQFNGNPKQLIPWTQSVDRVLKRYEHLKDHDIYPLWLQEIRNKITGEAGDLLASNGTSLDWESIKSQLTIMYGDKRELSTLLQKLFSLRQNNSSVEDFYSWIQDCFTGISTHIQMDSTWNNSADIVKFVDRICLEKFIDGLEEPFSSHVGLLQPKDLNSALSYAMEKANRIARRTGEFETTQKNKRYFPPIRPQPSPITPFYPQPRNQTPFNPYQNHPKPQPRIQSEQIRNPQNYRTFPTPPSPQQQQTRYHPAPSQNIQRPQFTPRPQQPPSRQNFPKPEPMDIDRSMRSRNINYMNRPRYQEVTNTEQEYFDYHVNQNETYHDAYGNLLPDYQTTDQTNEDNQNNEPVEDDLNFQVVVDSTPQT